MLPLTTSDGNAFRRFPPSTAGDFAHLDDLFDDIGEEVVDHFDADELGTVLGDPRLRQREYVPDED